MQQNSNQKATSSEAIAFKVGEILDHVEKYPFAPRGARIDPTIPDLGFKINDKLQVWADNLEELYEKAKAEQWNATTDIPWHLKQPLPDDQEKAVSQLMTFLAENEFIALYLPAKFLPRINPHFTEATLFLSTQIVDEARHVEVFSKRALIGAGPQEVSSETQYALKSLLEIDDYIKAKFLLNILGEGTFDDLFTFLIPLLPDPVSKEMIRRAKVDESRHVAYGVARTRRQLEKQPTLKSELMQAIEERASYLYAVSGADKYVVQALSVIAGGGSEKKQVEAGMTSLAELHKDMYRLRVHRLVQAGFTTQEAEKISELHGSAVKSFM